MAQIPNDLLDKLLNMYAQLSSQYISIGMPDDAERDVAYAYMLHSGLVAGIRLMQEHPDISTRIVAADDLSDERIRLEGDVTDDIPSATNLVVTVYSKLERALALVEAGNEDWELSDAMIDHVRTLLFDEDGAPRP